jgi:hypothetical protein
MVGTIDLSGREVEGVGEGAPGGIQDATEGAHMQIVPHGRVKERVVFPRREVGASAERIVKIGRFIHSETEYKRSVACSRSSSAEAARRRVCQTPVCATVWGGNRCTEGAGAVDVRPWDYQGQPDSCSQMCAVSLARQFDASHYFFTEKEPVS